MLEDGNQSVSKDLDFSENFREESILPSSLLPGCYCWRFLACRCITAISVSTDTWSSPCICVCVQIYLFLQEHRWLNSVQFSRSVVSDSLWHHESQHARPPCPSPTPGVYSNSCPLNRWCHPAISSSVVPFSSCPQSLPASGSFQMSQLFTWGGQSIGHSFHCFPIYLPWSVGTGCHDLILLNVEL